MSSKGVDTTKKKLKSLSTESSKAEKKVTRLQTGFKDFGKNARASVTAIEGPLSGISSRLSALTTVATAGGLAVTALAASVTALSFAVVKGVKELDELNVALAKSEALISATGGAVGFTAQQLQDQARATAFATLASVQGIQEAQSILLTFNRVTGSVFTDAIGLTQDLATVFGGSAASSATQLGKALQDPITGITALNRVGISFTNQQKEQVKVLTQSGKVVEAQSIIIQTLKDQVGGAGEAVAKASLAGSLDTLGQSFDQFTETVAISTGALELYQSIIDKLSSGIQNRTAEISPDTAAQAAQKALDLLFTIAAEEEKLAGMRDGIVKRSQQAKVTALKKEREELLSYARENAAVENSIILERGAAQEKSIKLQKERAAAAAKENAIAKTKAARESAELATFNAATTQIQNDWAKRVAVTQAGSLAVSEATKAQFVAEAEESFDYKDRLTALEESYNVAREKAAGQNAILKQIDMDYKTSMETLESDHQQTLSEIRKTAAQERIQEAQQESEALISAYASVAGGVSNSFSAITDAISASGDESSAAYKTAFALSKGFATAQAALNLQLAVSQALALPADVTLAQKFASYAAVLSAGASVVSGISGINYSGRMQGGTGEAGETYKVGERGPELVTFGREGGSVKSNSQSQQTASKQKTNYTIVNQTSGNVNQVEQQNITANDVVLILKESLPGEVKNANSGFSKATTRNTTSRRRYR